MASGSDDAFDRDAYEEYWDAEEAKHAAAMRSPFKIYPGWGGEAPREGGDADEDEDEDADEDESDSEQRGRGCAREDWFCLGGGFDSRTRATR